MYQIGIISKAGADLTKTRSILSHSPLIKLDVYTDAPNAVSILKSRKLNAMVVLLDNFGIKQLGLIEKIRVFHPGLPLAFLARKVDFEIQKRVMTTLPNTIILNSDIEISDLPGIVLRMVNGKRVYNRTDRRQKTMQMASIEISENNLTDQGCVLDMAGKGARVRTFKPLYRPGERVSLKIPLTFVNKTYHVDAEVVWVKEEQVSATHPSKSQLVGVQFINVLG